MGLMADNKAVLEWVNMVTYMRGAQDVRLLLRVPVHIAGVIIMPAYGRTSDKSKGIKRANLEPTNRQSHYKIWLRKAFCPSSNCL
jgi:hypothetical protein